MKRTVIISLHLCYWLLYSFLSLVFILLITGIGPAGFTQAMNHALVFLFIAFVFIPGLWGFYTAYFFLFRFFLQKKKLWGLLITGLLSSVIGGMVGASVILLLFPKLSLFNNGFYSAASIIGTLALISFLNSCMALLVRGFITWYNEIKVKEELGQKNFETELALVKSQINPHFLFNTINNIDVLIGMDPDKASAYLNKLSDIMRFMLYETKTGKTPLEKELEYIEKYIALQKIRTSNPAYVRYRTEGDPGNIFVEPMLLIPFVENAFKHAAGRNDENLIAIFVSIEKDRVEFICENKYEPSLQPVEKYGGLGNALIKKRLQLLYPNQHALEITKTSNIYKVRLTLYVHHS